MSRFALAAAAIAAVLTVVSGAQAKVPPDGVDVCGPSACVQLGFAEAEEIWVRGYDHGRPMRTPSPFYVMRYRWYSSGPEQIGYYVPAGPAVRLPTENGGAGTWMWLDAETASAIDRAVAGVAPHPVRHPGTVMVGEKRARGPETYFRLLPGRADGLITPATVWLTVTMRSTPPTPWTDGASDIRLSARGKSRLVLVDGWVHKVPLRVANRARRGLPLMP
jgi:hypothetical protein